MNLTMNIFPLNRCYTIERERLCARRLTGRELEILEMVSQGMSTGEIARNLYLSEETIKSHRKSLMVKFGARNMAQMIRLAFEQGVFEEGINIASGKANLIS